MSLWKRGRQYWTDFTVNGRRYRKRLGTTNLRVATRRERELIEEAGHGRLPVDEQGPKRLSEAIDAYLAAKRIRCSARTIELEEERLSIVKKHFGDVPLSAITATTIADFQRARHDAGNANRTINMDVGVLSRVLKFCGRWRALADHVKNLPERQRPVGRALTPEERRRLFDVAASNPEWEHVYCAAIVAANTSMRPVEVKHIRRCDVDLVKRLRARSTEQERDEPSRHPAERLGDRSRGAHARTRRSARAHGAGALPLARVPVGTIRSDEADAAVGHGLARAAGRRRPARLAVPRPAAHGHHRARRDGRRRSRARIDQRPPVAPDAGALLAHPHRREAPGARRPGRRSAQRSANGNGDGDSSKGKKTAPDEGGD